MIDEGDRLEGMWGFYRRRIGLGGLGGGFTWGVGGVLNMV